MIKEYERKEFFLISNLIPEEASKHWERKENLRSEKMCH